MCELKYVIQLKKITHIGWMFLKHEQGNILYFYSSMSHEFTWHFTVYKYSLNSSHLIIFIYVLF